MATDDVEFADFTMSARAPRVAIVVRGDEHWQFWCRLALHEATSIWGGAGFVVVPHTDGDVHPAVLAAVVAYDPDYVVVQKTNRGDLDALVSGPTAGSADGPGPEDGADHPSRRADVDVPDLAGDQVRAMIMSACSLYRRWEADAGLWDEPIRWWPDDRYPFTRAEAVRPPGQGVGRGVDPDRSGAAALMVAARAGAHARPDPRGTGSTVEEDAAALRWCTEPDDVLGAPFLRGPALSYQSAFAAASGGLSLVRRGPRRSGLVVFGSAAADFALALLWDRVHGEGVWIPDEWLSPDGVRRNAVRAALHDVARRADRAGPLVTSASLSDEALDGMLAGLRTSVVPPRSSPDAPMVRQAATGGDSRRR